MSNPVQELRYGRIAATIHVIDIDRACDFYCRIFGFHKTFENGNPVGFVILKKDAAVLHVARYKDHKPRTQNVAHMLVDDADALYELCKKNNVRIIKGIKNQEHGLRAFVFEDPDGNRIDIGQEIP